MNWNITYPDESTEQWVLTLENSALTYTGPGRQSSSSEAATLQMSRATLDEINTRQLSWKEAVASGRVTIDKPYALFTLLQLLDTKLDPLFNIVTP
jgi:alkyl sulfatase BDS1-like metallo-beta-lactamase superfamily hydrolase